MPDQDPSQSEPQPEGAVVDKFAEGGEQPDNAVSDQRVRRKRLVRQRRRHRSKARKWLEAQGELLLTALVVATVIGSVLAVGTVHVPALLAVAPVALAAGVLAAWLSGLRLRGVPAPAVVAALLAIYSALQAVPLPMGWLESIAPNNADVWARSLRPFGEPAPSWTSVSLEPGASLVEALKWLSYAAVFIAAAVVGRSKGGRAGLIIVFASGLLTALVTLGHGLAGASWLYGIYEPTFRAPRWTLAPLLNPNNLAGYLNLATFCGLGLLFAREPVAPRWVLGLGIATMVGVTVVSASRGGVIALITGAVAVTFALTRARKAQGPQQPGREPSRLRTWLPFAATLAGGLVLALLGAKKDVWRELLSESTQKLALLDWTTPMLAAHPWLGVGRGAFETAFPPYRGGPGHVIFQHAENFAVQWGAEWGLPVASVAVLAFAWTLRPPKLRAKGDRVAAAACVGLVVLLLQNLVDLALEVAAVALAAAALLGALWGGVVRERHQRNAKPKQAGGTQEPGNAPQAKQAGARPRITGATVGFAAMGVALLAGAAAWGRHPAVQDRGDLQELYLATKFDEPASRATFRAELRAAIRRHPGDPYLPLLGALAARRTEGESPMIWVARALERDPMSGRPHFVLALALVRFGARNQALLELRLTAERAPDLVGRAAELALKLASTWKDLRRTVPEGRAGARMLTALAQRMTDPKRIRLRQRLLEKAIARGPALVSPREMEASYLVKELKRGPSSDRCGNRPACIQRIEDHIRVIHELAPESPVALILRARLLAAQSQRAEAERLLADNCGRFQVQARCWRWRVVIANEMKPAHRLDEAMASYLAAACSRPDQCAQAAGWLGDVLARRQDWATAASKYERAAREAPTPARWLKAASAASKAGQHTRAGVALRRARQASTEADPELLERIEKARQRDLLRLMREPR